MSSLALAFSFAFTFTFALSFTFALAFAFAFTFSFSFTFSFTFAFSFTFSLAFAFTLTFSLAFTFTLTLTLTFTFSFSLSSRVGILLAPPPSLAILLTDSILLWAKARILNEEAPLPFLVGSLRTALIGLSFPGPGRLTVAVFAQGCVIRRYILRQHLIAVHEVALICKTEGAGHLVGRVARQALAIFKHQAAHDSLALHLDLGAALVLPALNLILGHAVAAGLREIRGSLVLGEAVVPVLPSVLGAHGLWAHLIALEDVAPLWSFRRLAARLVDSFLPFPDGVAVAPVQGARVHYVFVVGAEVPLWKLTRAFGELARRRLTRLICGAPHMTLCKVLICRTGAAVHLLAIPRPSHLTVAAVHGVVQGVNLLTTFSMGALAFFALAFSLLLFLPALRIWLHCPVRSHLLIRRDVYIHAHQVLDEGSMLLWRHCWQQHLSGTSLHFLILDDGSSSFELTAHNMMAAQGKSQGGQRRWPPHGESGLRKYQYDKR
mmetsp:Transcript_15322/g.35954  ORF Transcript_15322/g.35954 Transcript_15322/m.35954 type:complete len:491 (+) Transcript_15322:1078-2550(+)